MALQRILGVPGILRRKLRSFTREIMAEDPLRALPRACARLNKLEWVQFGLRDAILPWRVRTLRLFETPAPGPDEVVVLSVMRDGMPWLHTFLAHHRELGARHFVILDNDSTDGARKHLLAQADVTLLSSHAPYRHYENTFKRYLCNRFAADGWCLLADVDELLAYPGMERQSSSHASLAIAVSPVSSRKCSICFRSARLPTCRAGAISICARSIDATRLATSRRGLANGTRATGSRRTSARIMAASGAASSGPTTG